MGTWIVGMIVAAILALAVWKLIHDRKNGKTCGSCDGCCGCSGKSEKQ